MRAVAPAQLLLCVAAIACGKGEDQAAEKAVTEWHREAGREQLARTEDELDTRARELAEERERARRFDLVQAARTLVRAGLGRRASRSESLSCERIVGAATITSIQVSEEATAALAEACQRGDLRARRCLLHLVEEIHTASDLVEHFAAVADACVKGDPDAFAL